LDWTFHNLFAANCSVPPSTTRSWTCLNLVKFEVIFIESEVPKVIFAICRFARETRASRNGVILFRKARFDLKPRLELDLRTNPRRPAGPPGSTAPKARTRSRRTRMIRAR
jgi:hypothetical protein